MCSSSTSSGPSCASVEHLPFGTVAHSIPGTGADPARATATLHDGSGALTALGTLCGLAWAAGFRGLMADLAGVESGVSWYGTFVQGRVTFRWTKVCVGDWAMSYLVDGDVFSWSDFEPLDPNAGPEEQRVTEVVNGVPWTRMGDVPEEGEK